MDTTQHQPRRFRPAPFTTAIVLLNLATFAVMATVHDSWLAFDVATLRAFGANYGPWTTHGQEWRLFTCLLVHGGLVHTLLAAVSLGSIGHFVEDLLGTVGTGIVYFVTGLAGSLTSTAFSPHLTSVGSSGAIFGLLGATLALLWRERRAQGVTAASSTWQTVAAVVVANLALGFLWSDMIDNAAHLGGLAGGLAMGFALATRKSETAPARPGWRRVTLASICALAALSCATAFLPGYADIPRELATTHELERAVHERATTLLQDYRAGRIAEDAFRTYFAAGIVWPLQAERDRLASLRHVPPYFEPHRESALRTLEARLQLFALIETTTSGN